MQGTLSPLLKACAKYMHILWGFDIIINCGESDIYSIRITKKVL